MSILKPKKTSTEKENFNRENGAQSQNLMFTIIIDFDNFTLDSVYSVQVYTYKANTQRKHTYQHPHQRHNINDKFTIRNFGTFSCRRNGTLSSFTEKMASFHFFELKRVFKNILINIFLI